MTYEVVFEVSKTSTGGYELFGGFLMFVFGIGYIIYNKKLSSNAYQYWFGKIMNYFILVMGILWIVFGTAKLNADKQLNPLNKAIYMALF